jgi:carboxyl-terminal processing protease
MMTFFSVARLSNLGVLLALALGCAVLGCRAPAAAKAATTPPALALETFDEVWRIINDHHFDTNFNGHDWLEVKGKYRPRVAASTTQREARDTIQEMLKLLDVSHLALVPGDLADIEDSQAASASVEEADEEDSGTLGLHVRYAGTNLLVTRVEAASPAADAGVRPGWILRRVAGRNTADFKTNAPENLDERRRDFLAWRAVSKRLSGWPGSEVNLEFLDEENQAVTLNPRRGLARGEAIQFGNLPVLYAHLVSTNVMEGRRSIGVIRFNIWMLPTALAFHRALDEHRGRDGIVIDLRGNVGGIVGMIIGVAGHFVTEPLTLGTLVARDNKLKLPANPRFADATGKRVEPFAGPVAILVDEITASASEVFTGGLQEHGRVRVFGRTTAGQALPAIYDALPNGDALYHPVADFVTPQGTRFEGRGVVPDEEVPLNRASLLSGVDPVLRAAQHWIASEKKASLQTEARPR